MTLSEFKRVSKEAYAYTPGLKVKRQMIVTKTRRLPIPGEVCVKVGDTVDYNTVVAKTEIGAAPEILKVSSDLDVEPRDIKRYMRKRVGDHVSEGEIIATYNSLFGLIKKEVRSPIEGTVESISNLTGYVVLRRPPVPIEVKAYIPGNIIQVLPREGVVVQTNAAFIQGIFGLGGERHGVIRMAVRSPDDEMTVDCVAPEDKGKVLVGGSFVSLDALKKAVDVGVSCVVTGGLSQRDVVSIMGEEIGVAITGQEELGLTLIVTEGFGRMRMAKRTFDLLKSFEGYLASVNGATQIRAGVLRPEIVIPHEQTFSKSFVEELAAGIVPGTIVRIIREPYFGAIAKVVSLPVELQKMESESYVRVLVAELEDGSIVTVPRANVEIIEG